LQGNFGNVSGMELIVFQMVKTMKISNKNIGSERVASALDTVNNLGLLCESTDNG